MQNGVDVVLINVECVSDTISLPSTVDAAKSLRHVDDLQLQRVTCNPIKHIHIRTHRQDGKKQKGDTLIDTVYISLALRVQLSRPISTDTCTVI